MRKDHPGTIGAGGIAARVGLVLGAIAVALALGEALDPHVYLYVHLRKGGLEVPYLPGAEADLVRDEFRVRYTINTLGFRDAPRSVEKPANAHRVVVLGDSHGAGWGVDQDATFAAQLEASLGPPHEVWNTAKHAGCPTWYLFQARDFSQRFSADVFVVQLFDNDPIDSWNLRDRFPRDVAGRIGELPERYRWDRGPIAGLKRWYRHRALRKRLRRLSDRWAGEELLVHHFLSPGALPWRGPLPPEELELACGTGRDLPAPWEEVVPEEGPEGSERGPEWQAQLDHQEELLRQIAEEAKGRGTGLVLVYVPLLSRFRYGPDLEAVRAHNPYYQTIARVARDTGSALVDLQEWSLREPERVREFFFGCDGHLNTAGHSAVAAALLDPVSAALAERARHSR